MHSVSPLVLLVLALQLSAVIYSCVVRVCSFASLLFCQFYLVGADGAFSGVRSDVIPLVCSWVQLACSSVASLVSQLVLPVVLSFVVMMEPAVCPLWGFPFGCGPSLASQLLMS